MSQPTFLTMGDEVLDRELADLRRLIDSLSARVGGAVSGGGSSSGGSGGDTIIIQQPPPVLQTIYIGEPILNGTSACMLYVDSSITLAQDTAIKWDDSLDRLGIGESLSSPAYELAIRKSAQCGIGINAASATAASGTQLYCARSRGTIASPSDIQSGDTMLDIVWNGVLSSINYPAAQISGLVDGAPAATHCPGRLCFYTSSSTADTVERMRIDSTGHTGIGVTSPTAVLHLAAGTATANTGPLKFTSGTNLTSPEAGAMEWDGTHLYITQTSGPTRKTLAFTSDIATFTRGCLICLCAALTPSGTGADTAEYVIPYDPADGTTSITWNVKRIDFRVQTAGGAPQVRVEKSTASGAFSASTVGDVTLGSGASEGNNTTSLGTVASGNKIRLNFITLATATGWTVEVLLSSVLNS